MTVLATTGPTFWTIALIIGLVAALIVAVLLVILVNTVRRIESSVCVRSRFRSWVRWHCAVDISRKWPPVKGRR